MNKCKLIPFFLLFFLIMTIGCHADKKNSDSGNERYVVVLSCDGFRASYVDTYDTPSLHEIAQKGLRSSIQPCYPSLTFPNHYSLATGLYPEHHGLVHNTFYDKEYGRYSIGDRSSVENPVFYQGEPIWNTAQRQGLIAASYFWVGSETKINGMQPKYWYRYNGKISYKERADQVIAWLKMPMAERPRLIMWYLDEPDHTGHHYGPESKEVANKVKEVDDVIGYFVKQLEQLSIAKQVDFIIVADHGMAQFDKQNYVNLADYLDRKHFTHIAEGIPTMLYTPANYVDKAMKILAKVPHIKAYRKADIPKRFMYNDNDRIGDIVVVPDIGTQLQFRIGGKAKDGGAHGYDNEAEEMKAIFFAVGPDFAPGSTHDTFKNITLYPLICKLLNIEPAANDADMNVAESLLKQDNK